MAPDFGGGEERATVFLRPEQDYVHFRREQEDPRHHSAERDAHAHSYNFGVAPEVDRHEGYPNHAGGVHGEADELGLVEVLGDVAGLHRVQRAEQYEDEVE